MSRFNGPVWPAALAPSSPARPGVRGVGIVITTSAACRASRRRRSTVCRRHKDYRGGRESRCKESSGHRETGIREHRERCRQSSRAALPAPILILGLVLVPVIVPLPLPLPHRIRRQAAHAQLRQTRPHRYGPLGYSSQPWRTGSQRKLLRPQWHSPQEHNRPYRAQQSHAMPIPAPAPMGRPPWRRTQQQPRET